MAYVHQRLRSVSIAGLPCENCSETRKGQVVCNDCIEGEEPEFDDDGEG